MVRSGTAAVTNPLDLYALEAALQLRELWDAAVVAITMGPPPAEAVLREALSLGCDDGVLLSDRLFGGADTWATSRTLAAAVAVLEAEDGRFDLIIAGERATDGDTGQVGPALAAWLDRPLASYVAHVHRDEGAPVSNKASDRNTALTVQRLIEDGYQILRLPLPAVMTVVKEIASPRLPTLEHKKRSRHARIRRLGAQDLGIPEDDLGLRGSPTRVVRITTPTVTRRGETVACRSDQDYAAAAVRIVDFLEEQGGLVP